MTWPEELVAKCRDEITRVWNEDTESEDVSTGLAGSVDVSKIGPKVDTSGVREALGLIDQTIYANEDNSHSVRWTNVEVIRMLRDIRAALTVTPKPMNDNTNQ